MYFSLRVDNGVLDGARADAARSQRCEYDVFTRTPVCSNRLIFINAIGISKISPSTEL